MDIRHGLQLGLALVIALAGCTRAPEGTDTTTTSPPPSEPTASPTAENIATTENGENLAESYEFLDGEVTFAAAPPWEPSFAGWDHGPTMTTLLFDDRYEERIAVVADPLPTETGCEEGPAPADAETLARTIRSDRDLEATEPVGVEIGGVDALRMDVVAAPGASVCEDEGWPQLMTGGRGDGGTAIAMPVGHRVRLYLLDFPGRSARILAIAVSAPANRFESVVEAAAPVVNSFEFRTR